MELLTVPASLRMKIGEPASEGLVDMFGVYHQIASERFERRLDASVAALRLELHDGLAGVRQEIANTRADVFKWTLMFWIGQFAAIISALSFMLPSR